MPAGEVWPERSASPGSCLSRGLLLLRFAASGSARGLRPRQRPGLTPAQQQTAMELL
jgi:hypothetical protein